jgi:hypothetical protein
MTILLKQDAKKYKTVAPAHLDFTLRIFPLFDIVLLKRDQHLMGKILFRGVFYVFYQSNTIFKTDSINAPVTRPKAQQTK